MAGIGASGLRALADQLRALAASLQAETDAAIDVALEATIARLIEATPEQERIDPRYPSHMRDEYRTSMLGPGKWELLNEAPYANLIFSGSRAHHIAPRTQSILAWPDDAGGYVFAHGVEHPGYEGNAALNVILDDEQAYLEDALQATVERLPTRFLYAFA